MKLGDGFGDFVEAPQRNLVGRAEPSRERLQSLLNLVRRCSASSRRRSGWRPTSGKASTENSAIGCSIPSSKIRKSFCWRSVTSSPALSFTVTGTTTSDTVVRIRARGSWVCQRWRLARRSWAGRWRRCADCGTAEPRRPGKPPSPPPGIFVDNSWCPVTISAGPGLPLPRILMSGAASNRSKSPAGGDYTMRDSSGTFLSVRYGACRGLGLRRAARADPRASEPGEPVRHGARQTQGNCHRLNKG